MQINTFLLELVKFTLAGIGTVYVAFYLIKPYLERSEKLQLMELKKSTTALTLPLRFQAYERLIVFVERVNPANMLVRLHGTQYSAHELHSLVVSEIREEFQHNVSQQIYVSERAWNVIKRVKDDTMSVITNAIKALPDKCQEVFILSRKQQLSNREIADRMQISVKTVENHITNAIHRLKASIGHFIFLVSIFSDFL